MMDSHSTTAGAGPLDGPVRPASEALPLVERLRLIAAWATPGGPTPSMKPDKMATCNEAADRVIDLTREVENLRAALKWYADCKRLADYIAARDAHPFHVARRKAEAQATAEFEALIAAVHEQGQPQKWGAVLDDCVRVDLSERIAERERQIMRGQQ